MAIIVQLKNIDKFYGGTPILRNVNMYINEKERVGLVGPNGAGKTTLLKVITSEIQRDQGEIYHAKKARIGYLPQDGGLDSEKTIWEEMLSVFEPIRKIEKQLRQLEQQMGSEKVLQDQIQYQRILHQYSQLQETFEKEDGYSYEARIRGALHGLGLGELDWVHTPIPHLSGGQKTRLALAKLLLEAPDLLILDEPTNHLDLEALTWLEQTLSNYTGALLVVSHDRYFLDRFVETIYEISRACVTRYPGNYSAYVKARAEKIALWEKEYEQQQNEIRRMEEFIQRNLARASTTKRAQSRRKALERMEKISAPPKPEKKADIRFSTKTTSGRKVLQVENLAIGYKEESTPLITSLTFELQRGERVALIGPNGIGKTTLLKTLAGHLPPYSGNVYYGTGVEIDYYDQEQEDLDPTSSVLEELWKDHPTLDQRTIRSYLGQFLFSGEEVFKQVGELSGGEKARLSLAKRMLKQANLLLMDEPTNHLDMNSKEQLEEALLNYPGTLLFVSHDRYFINRLATRVIELHPDGCIDIPGNYDYYLEKKQLSSSTKEHKNTSQKGTERKKEIRRRQRELAQLEEQIEVLEAELEAMKLRLFQPEVYNDYEESRRLQQEMEKIEQELAEKTEQWIHLAEEADP